MKRLPRRSFLRGAGVLLGLPVLEAMLPARAHAAGPAPQRFGAFYFANGVLQQGAPGSANNHWTSIAGPTAREFTLSRTLAGLQDLRSEIVLIDNLFNSTLYTSGGGGAHWAATTGFLAGQAYVPAGVSLLNPGRSLDQELADRLQGTSRLRALVMGTRPTNNPPPGDFRGTGAYFNHVSWTGQRQQAFRHATSMSVFDALFGGGAPPAGSAPDPAAVARRAARKSVLDFVQEDLTGLQKRLGSSDRARLDAYLTGVNELEKRIDAEGTPTASSCAVPAREGFVTEDFRQRVKNQLDLWVLAFQCDLTRVVTFMLETEHNYNPLDESAGIGGAHHDVSHYLMNGTVNPMAEVGKWQVAQLGYLLRKLKAIPDVDGRTLLDNSVILYGTGIGDGDSHKAEQTPVVLAGRGAGLDPGRMLNANGARWANLLLALGQKFGLPLTAFGDSNGTLAQL
jgi:hypothetical protein